MYLNASFGNKILVISFFFSLFIFIDREAREIMYLVASVRPSVRPSVHPSALSRLNRLTYDLDFWYGVRP